MSTHKDGYVMVKVKDWNLEQVAMEVERLNSYGICQMPDGRTVEGEYDFSGDGMCIKFYQYEQPKKAGNPEMVLAEAGIDQIE